tara:strand:+ start:477 stop:599 length:123 start_codon:yes stop_codon:yes gene_type:complete
MPKNINNTPIRFVNVKLTDLNKNTETIVVIIIFVAINDLA